MSSVVISGDTSGSITLAAPAVSGTNTATLPAATGTVMVSGNMPAFSAYPNTGQTLSATTYTKILFQSTDFDTTGGMYASSRLTPTVAGYYQVNTAINYGTAISRGIIKVYKNGTGFKTVNDLQNSTANANGGSALVYCNGSTDYIEIYAWAGVGCTLTADSPSTWFQAVLVRN